MPNEYNWETATQVHNFTLFLSNVVYANILPENLNGRKLETIEDLDLSNFAKIYDLSNWSIKSGSNQVTSLCVILLNCPK